jgi:hypothetical protein
MKALKRVKLQLFKKGIRFNKPKPKRRKKNLTAFTQRAAIAQSVQRMATGWTVRGSTGPSWELPRGPRQLAPDRPAGMAV